MNQRRKPKAMRKLKQKGTKVLVIVEEDENQGKSDKVLMWPLALIARTLLAFGLVALGGEHSCSWCSCVLGEFVGLQAVFRQTDWAQLAEIRASA